MSIMAYTTIFLRFKYYLSGEIREPQVLVIHHTTLDSHSIKI